MYTSRPLLIQAPDSSNKIFIFMVLLFILCLNIVIHLAMLDITPYQDEGNYIAVAKWINEGDLFYRDMWNERGPVMYLFTAAIFKLFPSTVETVRIVALFYSCIQLILLYFFTTHFVDRKWALIAPLFYLLFHPLFMGTIYRSESLDVVLIIISVMFIYQSSQYKIRYLVYSGISVGLLMLDKQTGVLFYILGILFLFHKPPLLLSSLKAIMFFTIGIAIPWAGIILYYLYHGEVMLFIMGIMTPVLHYRIDQYARIPNLTEILQLIPFLFINVSFFIVLYKRDKIRSWFFALFSIVCFSFNIPAFFHYQIQILLVPTSIALACIVFLLKEMRIITVFVVMPISLLLIVFETIIAYHHMVDYIQPNRWQEMKTTGEYINENTEQDDVIWVFPHETNLYLTSDRKSASRYQFLLPWIATEDVLVNILEDLQKNKPKIIVYSNLYRDTTSGIMLNDYAPTVYEYLIENYYIDSISKFGFVLLKRRIEGQSISKHQVVKMRLIFSVASYELFKNTYY